MVWSFFVFEQVVEVLYIRSKFTVLGVIE